MRISLITALTVALLCCHPPATVIRDDGRVYEGPITGSDAEYIYVDGEPVERQAIQSIDHPGNVAAGVGTALAVLFGVAAIACLPAVINPDEDDATADLAPGLLGFSTVLFAVGTGVAIYGFRVWNRSKDAARPPNDTDVVIAPGLVESSSGAHLGGFVSIRW